MERVLLGWPADGPTLELDHRQFAYAGRFRVAATGKAVAREDSAGKEGVREDSAGREGVREDSAQKEEDRDEGAILAATAFNEDRSDPNTLKIRTVTVRRDRRGEDIGPSLLRFTRERAAERGYERVVIAVNNPFAYEAAVRAGFGHTGEQTGVAEVVLAWPAPAEDRYEEGLRQFADRDLEPVERSFIDRMLSDADGR